MRVVLLSGAGDVLNTSDAAASYQMLSSGSSPLVEGQSSTGGSELGGATLCLYGQRLNGNPNPNPNPNRNPNQVAARQWPSQESPAPWSAPTTAPRPTTPRCAA